MIGQQYRHGDLVITSIAPADIRGEPQRSDILGGDHSGGHHHTVAPKATRRVRVTIAGETRYVHSAGRMIISHDGRHAPLELPAGAYRIDVKREGTNDTDRAVVD